MPIPLPNLDDRTFDDLTAEARALIPGLQPDWTNHNASDPGIMLVELLAWLTEMLLFQVNQIPTANIDAFLRLLNEPDWSRPKTTDLEAATRETMVKLRQRVRAVTAEDYEALTLAADQRVRRVRCIPQRDLASTDDERRSTVLPAHVSVVVVPAPTPGGEGPPRPDDDLRGRLWDFLDERRMLTTRHHVVGPHYVDVEIAANLALRSDAPPDDAMAAVHTALVAFLDPHEGGRRGSGWPFGRPLRAAEIYAVLDRVASVDYVEDVRVNGVDLVELDAHGLVWLTSTALTAYDVHGERFAQTVSR